MRSTVQHRLARVHAAGILVPVAYLLIGAALYASTLDIFFMSDDFDFLTLVAPAESVSVIFEPLGEGRFLRPLVVLMYYANYHTIGLAPWGYHVSTLLPHFINAWLVYLVARRLGGRDDQLWAFLAGLLFLVFSGHSEAVSWPAGIADPILTVFLLTAFLCYLRALEPGASAGWLAAMFAAVLVGTQAKELCVVFPGLLVVHALAFGVLRRSAGQTPRPRRGRRHLRSGGRLPRDAPSRLRQRGGRLLRARVERAGRHLRRAGAVHFSFDHLRRRARGSSTSW